MSKMKRYIESQEYRASRRRKLISAGAALGFGVCAIVAMGAFFGGADTVKKCENCQAAEIETRAALLEAADNLDGLRYFEALAESEADRTAEAEAISGAWKAQALQLSEAISELAEAAQE